MLAAVRHRRKDAIADRRHKSIAKEVGTLPSTAPGGNRWHSTIWPIAAFDGTRRRSAALDGTQGHSEAIRGILRGNQRLYQRLTQRQSEALRGTRRHSEALGDWSSCRARVGSAVRARSYPKVPLPPRKHVGVGQPAEDRGVPAARAQHSARSAGFRGVGVRQRRMAAYTSGSVWLRRHAMSTTYSLCAATSVGLSSTDIVRAPTQR